MGDSYTINKNGTYTLTGGDYEYGQILITGVDDVTLKITGNITCTGGNFITIKYVSGEDALITIDGSTGTANPYRVTGTGGSASLISATDSSATIVLKNVALSNENGPVLSVDNETSDNSVLIQGSTLHSSSTSAIEFVNQDSTGASSLRIVGTSKISSDSTLDPVVVLYGPCNFELMDDASISGGSVGVYVNANDASTSIDIDHSTIEGARVAGIQWEALNSKLDSLSLNAPTFKNNTVDILLPNVDSSDSNGDNNVLFNAMYLSSDVTFSFPNVKDSCTAGGIDSTDTLAHLKADRGAFEMDDTGILRYKAKGSSKPTTKKDPPENAYVPELNGDSFINLNYEDVEGKTLAELGIEASRNIPGDTTDYGETSLHFYSEHSYDSGFGGEISADTIPEIGKTYYATVETAGNDTYNAREYTQVCAFIAVRYAPKADNYKVTLKFNGAEYDLADATDPVVVPSDTTYTVDKEIRNTSADAGRIYEAFYRAADSTGDNAWSSTPPTEPGTYQISLEIGSTETSNSALHLISDKWVFTISAPKQDPDPDAYAVTYENKEQRSKLLKYSEFEGVYTTLGSLPLGYEAVKDVTGYGTPSLHYYKANKGDLVSDPLFSIDYDTEYKATDDLTPGAIYYVVVETNGTNAYTAARYDQHGMYVLIGNPDPEAANYDVMLNGDEPLMEDSSVSFGSKWSIQAQPTAGSGTGTVEKILYRKAESTTASWSDKQPTEPGTYAVALKVYAGDKYASADCLTCDDWRITINKGVLDSTTIATYFVFDGSNVSVSDEHADFADKVGEITTVYYKDGNLVTDLDADGKPIEPGIYGVGFKTEGTDYYEAYNSNGPVGDWELTVLAAPTADQYQVTLNGKDITEADPIDYDENIANRSEVIAHPTSTDAGNVTAYHYAMVKDGQPDTSILYDEFPTVPGTYQVYLDVRAGTVYAAKKGLTDPAWQFTIGQRELAPSDFTYDPKTNTFTSLPYGVKAEDVTIQYYTEDGELVTDFVKDANGKDVPRMAGTYQVGVTVKETEFYKGGTLTGAETGWTYEKPKNFVTIDDFAVTAPAQDAEIAYTGEPVTVKAEPNDNIKPVQYEVVYYDITDGYPGTKLDKAPTDAGTYTWSILVTADDNTEFDTELSGNTFTITEKAELDNTAVTVTVPEMREGADNSFDVTVSSNDETLSADDLEITYYDENGTELTEAPTTEGTYFYSIKIKADTKTTNFQPGATLTDKNGNTKFAYTIKPAAYTADTSYGDVDYEGKADGKPLTAGTEVTVTAPADTDTSAFRQWIITVDGEEIDATVDGLAKLGVTVDDDAAALKQLQSSTFTFTMPKGDVKISALTSNPQQEAFDQAAGTALIVTGAAAATGAVYYFGTTTYIRSQLPEGMAVPQNREQLAVALWTLAGKPATESTTVFTDVAADSEALPAIRWAVATGVMNANTTEDGTSFLAGNYVTRAETAYRIYKLQQQRAE